MSFAAIGGYVGGSLLGGGALGGAIGTAAGGALGGWLGSRETAKGVAGPAGGTMLPALNEGYNLYRNGGFATPLSQQHLAGANALIQAGQGLDPYAQQALGAYSNMLQGGINPYTTSMIQAGQQDLLQDYAREALPRISNDAQAAGGFGGSRQGVAQGIATEGLLESMGDLSTRLLGGAYDTNQRNILGALQASPQIMGSALLGPQAQIEGGAIHSQNDFQTSPGQNWMNFWNAINGYGQSSMGREVPTAAGGALQGAIGSGGLGDLVDILNGGNNNTVADAYSAQVTNNPASFGWAQAYY